MTRGPVWKTDLSALGRSGRSRAVWHILYVSLLLLILVLAAFVGLRTESFRLEESLAEARAETQQVNSHLVAQLVSTMNEHALAVRAIAAVFGQRQDVSQEEFERIAVGIIGEDDAAILNVALLQGSVITRVHPYERNAKALGTDVTYIHAQLPGLNLTRRNRSLTQSGPYALVQGGKGLIYRAPVMADNPETGRAEYWGSTAVVVSLDRVMKADPIVEIARGHQIALRSLDSAGQPRAVAYGDPAVFDRDPQLVTVRLPYGTWQVAAIPEGGWPTKAPHRFRIWSRTAAVTGVFLLLVYLFQRLSRQREEARRHLMQAIETIRDAFVMFDADDRLVLCNARYRDMYGLPPEAIRPGTPRRDVIRAILDRGIIDGVQGDGEGWLGDRLRELRKPVSETERRLTDGRWIRIKDARMPDGYSVGLHSDITDLTEARIRAEEASRAKSEFLGTVSHELRTPLTSIKGGLGLVLGGRLGEQDRQVRRLLTIAHDNCERLTRIVNDILDMQRIEVGRIEYNPEPLNVRELVDQAIVSNRSYAMRFGVSYEVRGEAGDDPVVVADRDRFLQVMDNLLSNAAKFSDPGGIVEVSVTNEGGDCRVGVRDFGRGIAPEQQGKLFIAFSQIDASDRREKQGSGLGLAIARRLVEDMGGRIGLESEVGRGSEFFVVFPRWSGKTGQEAPGRTRMQVEN